jgi:hypothetical protein
MSYPALLSSVHQLASLPRNTAQNGGSNFYTTAASLMRVIQATSEAARLRDVQRRVNRNDEEPWSPVLHASEPQELENDWGHLSRYVYDGENVPGHYVGPNVPYVQTIARALAYLAIMLQPFQGSGPS